MGNTNNTTTTTTDNSKDDYAILTAAYLEKAKQDFDERWENRIQQQNGTIDDFKCIKMLGSGAFGQVMLANHQESNDYYAIKILAKQKIVAKRQIAHAINEKNILISTKFPFLVQLFFAFKDNSNLYLVLEFVRGGEMFQILQQQGKFSEKTTAFFGAQVVLAFEYLHNLHIIYRDLKPENLLIDHKGYVKVTDFGFAKYIDNGRTYTACGTPDYMAPEILHHHPYGKPVDWWAVGVLLYEMAAGYPPFQAENDMERVQKIVVAKYRCPARFSKDLKDIIKNLIQIDVTQRYGCLHQGANDVKLHKFFKNINWIVLFQQKTKPEFVPYVGKDATDIPFFEGGKTNPALLKISPNNMYEKEFESF